MKIINLVLNNFVNDSRVQKTTLSLIKCGYDAQVVALHESGLLEKEVSNGLRVHRISLKSRNWSNHTAIQILKFIEFTCRFIANYRRVDVIHCNDLSALAVGFFTKMIRWKLKLVYDSHEYAINDLPNQSQLSIWSKYYLEKFLILFPQEVITVSNSIAEEYVRLYGIPKPRLVLNCPNFIQQNKNNFFRTQLEIREDQRIFLYQGGLSKGRGIELLLHAFTNFETDENVIVFMGYGPLDSIIQEVAKKSNTIFYYPAVEPSVLLNYTSSADFGISFIEDKCLSYRFCLPNKLFEYLMAGLPVITSNLYEMKKLVESECVGIVATDNSPEGLRVAIASSLEQQYSSVKNNVHMARKKYCWEEQEKILREIYSEI